MYIMQLQRVGHVNQKLTKSVYTRKVRSQFYKLNLLVNKEHNVEELCLQFSVIRKPLFIKHHHPGEQECLLSQGGTTMTVMIMLSGRERGGGIRYLVHVHPAPVNNVQVYNGISPVQTPLGQLKMSFISEVHCILISGVVLRTTLSSWDPR